MSIYGLVLVEIIGAALFSLAFVGGIQKLKNLCYAYLAGWDSLDKIKIKEHPKLTKKFRVFFDLQQISDGDLVTWSNFSSMIN